METLDEFLNRFSFRRISISACIYLTTHPPTFPQQTHFDVRRTCVVKRTKRLELCTNFRQLGLTGQISPRIASTCAIQMGLQDGCEARQMPIPMLFLTYHMQ